MALPTTKLGLRASKAADLMIDNGLITFGIRVIITSYQVCANGGRPCVSNGN